MKLTQMTGYYLADGAESHRFTMEETAEALHDGGYHYLEATLCTYTRKPHLLMCRDDWEDATKRVREHADALGVKYIQSHLFFPTGSPVHKDGWDVDNEFMRRTIIASGILGVEWGVMHPKRLAEHSPKEAFDFNYDYTMKWLELANKYNVGIALENLPPRLDYEYRFAVNHQELIELVDKINDKSVGICLDTGHASMIKADIPKIIREIGPRLRATHIHDTFLTGDHHILPFFGKLNWAEIMKALHDIGYEDAFNFECHNVTKNLPPELQRDLIKFSYKLGEYMLSLAK